MIRIKRLPTLEECNAKNYRELYYTYLPVKEQSGLVEVLPNFVLKTLVNIPSSEYVIFEFPFADLQEAYLKELETRLEYIKNHVDAVKPKGDHASDVAEAQAAIGIVSRNLEKYF